MIDSVLLTVVVIPMYLSLSRKRNLRILKTKVEKQTVVAVLNRHTLRVMNPMVVHLVLHNHGLLGLVLI